MTKYFIGEKGKWKEKKWTNKGNDKHDDVDFLLNNTLHNKKIISNVCTKFQISKYSSSWEVFDTNFPIHYIAVRGGKQEQIEKKKKKKKKKKNRRQNISRITISLYKSLRLWLLQDLRNVRQFFFLRRRWFHMWRLFCNCLLLISPSSDASLWKHAHSNILKISPLKNEKFHIKILIFFIYLHKTYIVGTR